MKKIGFVVDVEGVELWFIELLKSFLEKPDYDITLYYTKTKASKHSSLVVRWFMAVYRRLIDRHDYEKPAQKIEEAKVLAELARTASVELEVSDDQLRVVSDHRPIMSTVDILVVGNGVNVCRNVSQIVTKGVLIYCEQHYGYSFPKRLVGFWESAREDGKSDQRLYFWEARKHSYYLLEETSTHIFPLSLSDSRNIVLWKAVSLISRNIERLTESTYSSKRMLGGTDKLTFSTLPNITDASLFLVRKIFLKAKAIYSATRYVEEWEVLIAPNNGGLSEFSLSQFTIIPNPKGCYLADPFVYKFGGVNALFVEEFVYSHGKARLTASILDENGGLVETRPIIETEGHLSYPFLFENDGQLYMVPESADCGKISLYRCTQFPWQWEFVRYMVEGVEAYDSTLVKYGGLWWLFANVVSVNGMSDWDELHVFYSDDVINGRWLPHSMNPVVSDVGSSRPAGNLFIHEGKLMRFGQDSIKYYGYGFNMLEITKLTKTEYSEDIIREYSPATIETTSLGMHTMNFNSEFVVIDQLIRRSK